MTGDTRTSIADQHHTCAVHSFPLASQRERVREIARKLLRKITDKHADYYRGQVTDALEKRLLRIGIPEHVIDEQVGAFWTAVEWEMARLSFRDRRPGGAA